MTPDQLDPRVLEIPMLLDLSNLLEQIPMPSEISFESRDFAQENLRRTVRMDIIKDLQSERRSEIRGKNWTRRITRLSDTTLPYMHTDAVIKEEGKDPEKVGLGYSSYGDYAYYGQRAHETVSVHEGLRNGFVLRRIDVTFFPTGETLIADNDYSEGYHDEVLGYGFDRDGKQLVPNDIRKLRDGKFLQSSYE